MSGLKLPSNTPYIKGRVNYNSFALELNICEGNYNQSRVRPAFQDPDDKGKGLYPLKRAKDRGKRLYLSYIKE